MATASSARRSARRGRSRFRSTKSRPRCAAVTARAFARPSFDELFFPNFGNPNLKPEISSEYDGGFTTTFGERASFTATYFSRRVQESDRHRAVPDVSRMRIGSGQRGTRRRAGRRDRAEHHAGKGLTFRRQRDDNRRDSRRRLPGARPARAAAGGKTYRVGAAAIRAQREFSAARRITANVNYTFIGDRDDITGESTIANHTAYSLFNAVASYALGSPAEPRAQ